MSLLRFCWSSATNESSHKDIEHCVHSVNDRWVPNAMHMSTNLMLPSSADFDSNKSQHPDKVTFFQM